MTPVQQRFTNSGLEGLSYQEIVELLLSLVLPHRECRRQTKKFVEHFKNLRGLLTASPQELQQAGIAPACVFYIKLLHELPIEILKQKIIEQPVHNSSREIFDYLYCSMRDLKKEVFEVIYLNNRNQIIDAAQLFKGSLDNIPIRPRDIMESAFKHDATRLIFAHNHPSGDPTPSKSDKRLTRDLVFIGMILEIRVLDHIIIGQDTYFSFADERLIEKHEDSFFNLRITGVFDIGGKYWKNLSEVHALDVY